MILTVLTALFALISAVAAAYGWIQSYDLKLRLSKMESHMSSLQSRIGNVQASVQKEAAKAAQDAVAEHEIQSQGGGGGMDMEQLLPMFMGMQQNANSGAQQPEQASPNGRPSQGDPMLIGSGGQDDA